MFVGWHHGPAHPRGPDFLQAALAKSTTETIFWHHQCAIGTAYDFLPIKAGLGFVRLIDIALLLRKKWYSSFAGSSMCSRNERVYLVESSLQGNLSNPGNKTNCQ